MKSATKRHVCSAILAFTLAACDSGGATNADNERAMEDLAAKQGLDVDVTVGDAGEPEKIAINSGHGQVGMGLDLPSGFPSGVILPDDWKIMAATTPLPDSTSVQALVEQPAEDILASVRQRMEAAGWPETSFSQMTPQISQISFEKSELMMSYTITDNGATQMVAILTMPKP